MSEQPVPDAVPEADALEQRREVVPSPDDGRRGADLPRDDAADADVLEQGQEVPLDEDDHDR